MSPECPHCGSDENVKAFAGLRGQYYACRGCSLLFNDWDRFRHACGELRHSLRRLFGLEDDS